MTEQVRYRLDKQLARDFAKVCKSVGLTPTQAVSVFAAQMVRLRGLPFRPSEFPALEEYGVSLEAAEGALADANREIDSDKKAGRLVEFKGTLP
jgi:addiction module RelB/DinJ family antitoxin